MLTPALVFYSEGWIQQDPQSGSKMLASFPRLWCWVWGPGRDSNPGPPDPQSGALSRLSYPGHLFGGWVHLPPGFFVARDSISSPPIALGGSVRAPGRIYLGFCWEVLSWGFVFPGLG